MTVLLNCIVCLRKNFSVSKFDGKNSVSDMAEKKTYFPIKKLVSRQNVLISKKKTFKLNGWSFLNGWLLLKILIVPFSLGNL